MCNLKQINLATKAIAFLVLVMLTFVGCSESPTGVSGSSGPVLLSRTASAANSLGLSGGEYYSETMVSSREGGELQLHDVKLIIPPGAVDKDTLFSIHIPDISVFYNEFGTEGLEFNVPVTVIMSYREADLSGIKESTIRIGYFNKTTRQFEDIVCEVDFENKVVIGQLDHFSAYALISDEE